MSQQFFCYNCKTGWRYVYDLSFMKKITSKGKANYFYSNKCKHVELTPNPKTGKFETLM